MGEINFLAANFLLTGIVLSAANIMQVPFWTGWCLYLSQSGSIERTNDMVVLAVSAAAGTFGGMLLVVLALESLAERFHWFSGFLVTAVMPAIFVLMAGLQVLKLLRKKQ